MKNKIFWVTTFIVISVTVLSVLFVTLDRDLDKKSIENQQFTNDYYTVSQYKGKIAVFKNSETIPFEIYDVYISSLPNHDKVLLERGIEVETPEELQKIIEDYTS